MKWYLAVVKKYAVFSGRARRKEYWMFCLFNFLFIVGAILLDNLLGTAIKGIGYGLIYGLYVLAMLLPSFGVGIRRMHDVGKSGWFFLIGLIPIVGSIWILILLCSDGNAAENKYGLNPKMSG